MGDNLKGLSCSHSELDVSSPESIAAFARSLDGRPVDVLLSVAGIMIGREPDSLEHINKERLAKVFETNAFGPLLLVQALLPNVLKGEQKIIGIVSSRVGSIGDNSSGGIYAYRASKAAVNAIGKSLAMDLKEKGVTVSLLHPGYVRTGLTTGEEPHPDSVEPQEAATKLWKVLKSKRIEATGKFWHREGQELIW